MKFINILLWAFSVCSLLLNDLEADKIKEQKRNFACVWDNLKEQLAYFIYLFHNLHMSKSYFDHVIKIINIIDAYCVKK